MVTAADVKAYAEEHEVPIMHAKVMLEMAKRREQRQQHIDNLTTDHPMPSEMAAAIRFLLENMK